MAFNRQTTEDMWAFDDYQRRVVRKIFADGESDDDKKKLRSRAARLGICYVLSGIEDDNADDLQSGIRLLGTLLMQARVVPPAAAALPKIEQDNANG